MKGVFSILFTTRREQSKALRHSYKRETQISKTNDEYLWLIQLLFIVLFYWIWAVRTQCLRILRWGVHQECLKEDWTITHLCRYINSSSNSNNSNNNSKGNKSSSSNSSNKSCVLMKLETRKEMWFTAWSRGTLIRSWLSVCRSGVHFHLRRNPSRCVNSKSWHLLDSCSFGFPLECSQVSVFCPEEGISEQPGKLRQVRQH